MTLPTRPLGRAGLQLITLGFGNTGLGNLRRSQTEDGTMATVQAAYGAGLRYFDTAPLYGFGLAEHRIGTALRRIAGPVVLSTKAGWRLGGRNAGDAPGSAADSLFEHPAPFKPRIDYSYDGIMRSFADSLQRLGTDRVDILLLHGCDRRNHGEDGCRTRFRKAADGAARALVSPRGQGAVRAVGAGLNERQACQDFAETCDFDCFLLAGRYTLLDQGALTSFLPLCERRGIGVILGGPYNSGILAPRPVDGALYDHAPAAPEVMERTRALAAACARHAVPLRAATLQFPLLHPAIATVIPGARNPAEVTENLASMMQDIPGALWQDLRRDGLIR